MVLMLTRPHAPRVVPRSLRVMAAVERTGSTTNPDTCQRVSTLYSFADQGCISAQVPTAEKSWSMYTDNVQFIRHDLSVFLPRWMFICRRSTHLPT